MTRRTLFKSIAAGLAALVLMGKGKDEVDTSTTCASVSDNSITPSDPCTDWTCGTRYDGKYRYYKCQDGEVTDYIEIGEQTC